MTAPLTPEEQKKQEYYRDARFLKYYDGIWQSTGKCVFCDIREKYVLFEQDGMLLTITLYAYIDGDMMIVPRRHVTTASELTDREWEAVRKLMHIARKLIRETHGIRGVQFVQRHGGIQAQSTVEHLHFKCVPFDAPDLSVWNYRRLKHTPLENVALYKEKAKSVIKHAVKFDAKYAQASHLPLICDAIIQNVHGDILLQERADPYKFVPDTLTLPGGVVTQFDRPLEEELTREVAEETGLALDPHELTLVASRVSNVVRIREARHLDITYEMPHHFILNTYRLKRPLTSEEIHTMRAGDDCKAFVWVPREEIAKHPSLSPELQKTLSHLRV